MKATEVVAQDVTCSQPLPQRALRPDGSAAPPPASPRFQAQTSALRLSLAVQPRGGPPQTLSSPARGASAGSVVK